MKVIKTIEKVIDKISEFVSYISFAGIIIMMIFIGVDVFMRKVFSSAIVGSYEIVQYILMLTVFASFAFTQVKKMHVRVTLFLGKFPWWLHTLINGIWELACAAMIAVMGYAAIVQGKYLLDKNWTSDVLRFPIYPFHYVAGIFMFIFAIAVLSDALRYFFALGDKEYAEQTFKEYS